MIARPLSIILKYKRFIILFKYRGEGARVVYLKLESSIKSIGLENYIIKDG